MVSQEIIVISTNNRPPGQQKKTYAGKHLLGYYSKIMNKKVIFCKSQHLCRLWGLSVVPTDM